MAHFRNFPGRPHISRSCSSNYYEINLYIEAMPDLVIPFSLISHFRTRLMFVVFLAPTMRRGESPNGSFVSKAASPITIFRAAPARSTFDDLQSSYLDNIIRRSWWPRARLPRAVQCVGTFSTSLVQRGWSCRTLVGLFYRISMRRGCERSRPSKSCAAKAAMMTLR